MKVEMMIEAAVAILLLGSTSLMAVPQSQLTTSHLDALAQQGIPQEQIIGVDANGVPIICSESKPTTANLADGDSISSSSLLPVGMRSWECIPGVIRNDGIESFRLEVDVNGPVTQVTWDSFTGYLVAESGSNNIVLRDDGLNGDRVAGDNIFTSELLRYRTQVSMPQHQFLTTNTPAGLYMPGLGQVRVVETSGVTNLFLTPPGVGILNTNIPTVQTVTLASGIQASDHLINIMTTNREAQWSLRTSAALATTIQRVYQVMPDAFDFLSFFTTDHLEYVPFTTSANFVSGRHFRVRVNYSGTGIGLLDNGEAYGSSNRLLGANVFDTTYRGINQSSNPTHEYSHQWGARTSTALGLSTGESHFKSTCTADSLLGGFKAIVNANGTITRDCNLGFGPYGAPPLDKYMMGLISGASVPPLYVATNVSVVNCNDVLAGIKQVTIADIQAFHGVRSPGPATAKRDFSIGFVATSHNRLLNATEMTFYDILAAFYTKTLPPEAPTPGLGEGWVPVTRYFGEGVTWSSEMLTLIRPTITNVEWLTNNTTRVTGTGYPGRNYRLLGTTNFLDWTTITNAITATNGSFSLHDNTQPKPKARHYRVATP
jgi:hypothetical protein